MFSIDERNRWQRLGVSQEEAQVGKNGKGASCIVHRASCFDASMHRDAEFRQTVEKTKIPTHILFYFTR